MKRCFGFLLLTVLLLLLSACTGPVANRLDSYIGVADLKESEHNLVSLLGKNYPQQVFDFVAPETVKSMCVRVVKLVDGQRVQVSGGGTIGMTYTGKKGRIALDYDTLGDGIEVSIQKDGAIYRMEREVQKLLNTAGLERAQTWLETPVEIVLEKEIPLVMQFFSSRGEFPVIGMKFFDKPKKMENYEYVFAVTVTFSERGFGE